ncbi:hypothetical protein LMG33818_001623 [Halomonadaceae bacterium LMG 33818]|uniref:hypothetical protein n=1 Tax=Cernens ardua TaxID=3402176 RepID=UPI003EDC1045
MKPSPYFSNTYHSTGVQHSVLLYGNDISELTPQLARWQRSNRISSDNIDVISISSHEGLKEALQNVDTPTFMRYSFAICQPESAEHLVELVGYMTCIAHEALFLRATKNS